LKYEPIKEIFDSLDQPYCLMLYFSTIFITARQSLLLVLKFCRCIQVPPLLNSNSERAIYFCTIFIFNSYFYTNFIRTVRTLLIVIKST